MSKRLHKWALQSKSCKSALPQVRVGVCAESLEARLLFSAHPLRTISGRVFNDLNDNGTRQPREHWLAGVGVFLDINGNGILDAGEPQAVTNKSGTFSFKRLTSGMYDVVVVPPAGDAATAPANGLATVNVTRHSVLNLRFGDVLAPTPPVQATPPDTVPPNGALDAPPITTGGYSPYRFSVTWTDATAIDTTGFADGNVIVTGPDEYDEPGNLAAIDSTTDGSPRTTTYQIPAPTGGWAAGNDGAYTVTLQGGQIRDTLGNVDPTLTLGTFSVDISSNEPGAPVLLHGVNGAIGRNNASPAGAISFNVSNTVAGAELTLQADGVPIGSAVATAGSTLIASNGQSNLDDGTHEFSVSQMLAGGAESTSPPTAVIVDTTGPTASLTAATVTAAGASNYLFTVNYTDATAVSAASLATGNLQVTEPGGQRLTPILVSLDASVNGGTRIATYRIAAPGGSFTAADDGTYGITLLANSVYDELHNAAASRLIGTFAVSVGESLSPATGKPSLLPATDSGAFSNDDVTNFNNGSLAGRLQLFVPGTQTGATVTLFADGTPIGSAIASGTTTTVTTTGNLKLNDGMHLLTAEQTDPNSGPSPASVAMGIVIDTEPPTATSSPAPVSGAGATFYSFLVQYRDDISVDVSHLNTGNVIVTGPNGFSQTAVLELVNSSGDGSPRTATYTITPPGGSWQSADNGTYTIAVQAGQIFDTAGNAESAATLGTFTVNAGLASSPVPSAPNLVASSDTGVSSNDNLTDLNNGSTAGDLQFSVGGTAAGATVTVYADGTAVGAAVALGATTVVTTNGTTPLSDGPHTFTARQEIPGTGQSTDSPGTSVTIDTSPPTVSAFSAPDVTTAGGTSYGFTVIYADNVAVNVTSLGSHDVTVVGPTGAIVPVTFILANPDANGSPLAATYQISPPGGAWSSTDNGTYTVSFSAGQVRDTAGNSSAAAAIGFFHVNIPSAPTVTASSTAPTLLSSSNGLTNLNNSSPSQSLLFAVGGTIPGATVTIYADATAIGAVVASSSSTTVVTTGKFTLSDGTHGITAVQQSPGQLASARSAAVSIDVETSVPTASAALSNLNSSGGTTFTFTVTYSDAIAINTTSFDNNDILVTSTSGYSSHATLVAIDNPSAGSPRNVTYQIVPSDGTWSTADNGVYTVTLQSNQVFNAAGTAVTGGVLGTFSVNISPGT